MPDLLLGQDLVGTKVTLVLEYPLIMFSLATPIGSTQNTNGQVLFPSSHILELFQLQPW